MITNKLEKIKQSIIVQSEINLENVNEMLLSLDHHKNYIISFLKRDKILMLEIESFNKENYKIINKVYNEKFEEIKGNESLKKIKIIEKNKNHPEEWFY